MNDFTAGSSPGAQQPSPTGPWRGGSPPPVLLAALGAALLIAVTLTAFLIGSGSGGQDLQPGSNASANGGSSLAGDSDGRVRLRVTFDGDGGGEIKIAPTGIACSETCSNDIVTDTRVRVTADADIGSKFAGWSDACDGTSSCVFYMDRSRELGVTFEKTEPAKKPIADCDNDEIPDSQDSGCDDPPPAPPVEPESDCQDGKDNDGDGLIDTAQDPGCDFGSEAATEADAKSSPDDLGAAPPPPPPPPATPQDCNDGKDNDGDGLTDTAQDPGCDRKGTEADD